jgi:hypothetical protein
MVVTVVIQWCYSGVTVVLHWCYIGVTLALQWFYSDVTVVSRSCEAWREECYVMLLSHVIRVRH